jgi:hypothetical protein
LLWRALLLLLLILLLSPVTELAAAEAACTLPAGTAATPAATGSRRAASEAAAGRSFPADAVVAAATMAARSSCSVHNAWEGSVGLPLSSGTADRERARSRGSAAETWGE